MDIDRPVQRAGGAAESQSASASLGENVVKGRGRSGEGTTDERVTCAIDGHRSGGCIVGLAPEGTGESKRTVEVVGEGAAASGGLHRGGRKGHTIAIATIEGSRLTLLKGKDAEGRYLIDGAATHRMVRKNGIRGDRAAHINIFADGRGVRANLKNGTGVAVEINRGTRGRARIRAEHSSRPDAHRTTRNAKSAGKTRGIRGREDQCAEAGFLNGTGTRKRAIDGVVADAARDNT